MFGVAPTFQYGSPLGDLLSGTATRYWDVSPFGCLIVVPQFSVAFGAIIALDAFESDPMTTTI